MNEDEAALTIKAAGDGLVTVRGRVYRAVFAKDRDAVLAGSDRPGRFTPPGHRTLYTSATALGTRVALRPYTRPDDAERVVVALTVEADRICDLRDREACRALGFDAAEAALPWRDWLARGAEPPSWAIVRMLLSQGVRGVIDPSRGQPGLFHLALFAWNAPGCPRVTIPR